MWRQTWMWAQLTGQETTICLCSIRSSSATMCHKDHTDTFMSRTCHAKELGLSCQTYCFADFCSKTLPWFHEKPQKLASSSACWWKLSCVFLKVQTVQFIFAGKKVILWDFPCFALFFNSSSCCRLNPSICVSFLPPPSPNFPTRDIVIDFPSS